MSASSAAVMVPVPLAGEVQGPQRAMSTAPALPRTPLWMCAAVAWPVRWVKVSVHLSDVPVTVTVNLPVAPNLVPFGLGITSWPTLRTALNFFGAAAFALPAVASAASTQYGRYADERKSDQLLHLGIPSFCESIRRSASKCALPASSEHSPTVNVRTLW